MTQVDFHFIAPDGAPIANGQVDVRLAGEAFRNVESGVVVPRVLRETTDAEGRLSLDLWPLEAAEYTVTALDLESGRRARYSFYVPESEVPVRMQDLVMLQPPSPKKYDEASIAAIQAERLLSQDAVSAAQAEASSAAMSATSASGSASTAQTEASSAMSARQAAELARDDAQSLATDAQGYAAASKTNAAASGAWYLSADTSAREAEIHRAIAESAAADALAIYGSTAAVDAAILAAHTSETNAAASATEAGNHASGADASRTAAGASAAEAYAAQTQAVNAALSADGYAEDALAAYNAAVDARDAAQIERHKATQAAAKAEGHELDVRRLVSDTKNLIDDADDDFAAVLVDAQAARDTASGHAASALTDADRAEAANTLAMSTLGSAEEIEQSVLLTYSNRAIIETAIAHNTLLIRSQ